MSTGSDDRTGSTGDTDQQWWYCLNHRTVEATDACANSERMGPYPSREAAQRALVSAAERTEAWDEDPRWKDD